jgi:hypothetical protein
MWREDESVPAAGASQFQAEPFSVHVDRAVLDNLRARIRSTRLPEAAPGVPWAQGIGRDWLQQLLCYWADRFDWRPVERELNRFAHYRAQIGPAEIHFVHPGPGEVRSWSNCGADLESRFSRDYLLSVVTLYWVTGSITSSIRDYYYDNRRWQGEPRPGPRRCRQGADRGGRPPAHAHPRGRAAPGMGRALV